jgi:molybdenum cofactor cytidylyltransferase
MCNQSTTDKRMMRQTGIIILAAGTSSRMGKPKQLLPYQGSTLIRRITEEAVKGAAHPVAVVLGAYHELIAPEMHGLDLSIVVNEQWQQGMGGSVSIGIKTLLNAYPALTQVILVVADQPYVTAELFETMIHQQVISGKGIVACGYSDITGTPVLFDRKYFPALLELSGEAGAKKILQQEPADVEVVRFDAGAIDIDTVADYDQLTGINVQVRFFGRLTAITGDAVLSFHAVRDTDTLRQLIVEKYPSLKELNYIVAVDQQVINGNVLLSNEQTVAFMPPFSGG